MPALVRTRFAATITWLGVVENRDEALASRTVDALDLRFAGPSGESHGGLTRPSCSRVQGLYPRGTPIRNARQLSILSVEELALIAQRMGMPDLDPALIGATMVISGIPNFTHVPPASRLLAASGACLTIDTENRPCTLPGPPINARHAGFGARFKPAAKALRGVTAWVEAEGRVAIGDSLGLFIPDQTEWSDKQGAVAG